MKKLLNEKQVLKNLEIDDFRHITKDKIIKMASILDRMEPEVAKKALEQFPEFSNTAKEILFNYKEILDKAIISNDESIKSYYNICNSIISTLKVELEKEELSFEEKKYFIEQMKEVADMVDKKGSENKKFITILLFLAGAAGTITVGMLASTLGGNTHINSNNDDDDN